MTANWSSEAATAQRAKLLQTHTERPIVIGHRGACGYVPEHTLASYFIAIQQGADYIEPDLVLSKDGVLVARHENEIGSTTDVALHPAFAARRTNKTIDGRVVEGWFTEDFTLAELKTLRARERLPELRRANTRFDGAFEIPSLVEILELVRAAEKQRAVAAKQRGLPPPPRIGIYPETKHPSYFAGIQLPFEQTLLRVLADYGYESASDPVFIQSFEVGNLKALRRRSKLPLMQLISSDGQPFDFTLARDPRSYRDLLDDVGLAQIARYADAIGPHKELVVTRQSDGAVAADTGLARRARAAGLGVHVWTLRAENEFLPPILRSGGDRSAHGNLAVEIEALLDAGVTGFFTDHAAIAVPIRDAWQAKRSGKGN